MGRLLLESHEVTLTEPAAELANAARLGFRRAGQCGAQVALMVVVYLAGSGLVHVFGPPVPGNLVGLLILLGLLASGIIRQTHVESVGTFVLRYLTFFFVPFVVRLMAEGTLLGSAGLAIGASLVGSAAIGIGAAVLVTQAIARQQGASGDYPP